MPTIPTTTVKMVMINKFKQMLRYVDVMFVGVECGGN